MKISASVLSSEDNDLKSTIQILDRLYIDYIHIDCQDDPRVFEEISRIRNYSSSPIDLHLITPKPERYFELIEQHSIEMVSIQIEAVEGHLEFPERIKSKFGLAAMVSTPPEIFRAYSGICSFVLLMTTTPGKSGGTFDKETFSRVREYSRKFPKTRIHVDGGVNDEISFALRSLGVSCVVSGSYLVNSEEIPTALMSLRTDQPLCGLTVESIMTPVAELPVLVERGDPDLLEILESINDSKLGFTLIVDEEEELSGIVTDGDIRRSIIGKINCLEALSGSDVINRKPIKIQSQTLVRDMLQAVSELDQSVVFLPIVDQSNKVIGTLLFNSFIRGEL